ncbi:double-strand-break repair protein rad21 homolog isoform X2 [Apostichopus japonicus]|uniref:double-strand-break repair protein rad21 homolog isoform X2 n=1 Tax=Stichopus japonicus TaxID=307972 RepID=UPI003AB6CEFE
MFYAHFVLSKKGPLARIWLAAHWDKKLTKAHVYETNVSSCVDSIMHPKVKLALRTSGHLLLGVVRIHSRKAKYLLADCNEAFVKIKMAFRPGVVDLPEENREAAFATITLPEVFHDFDTSIPDFNDVEVQKQFSLNQSRVEDITMKEDLVNINLGQEDFGDLGFDDREMLREASAANDSTYKQSDESTLLADGSKTKEAPIDASMDKPMDMGLEEQFRNDGFGAEMGMGDGILGDEFMNEGGNLFEEQPEIQAGEPVVVQNVEPPPGAAEDTDDEEKEPEPPKAPVVPATPTPQDGQIKAAAPATAPEGAPPISDATLMQPPAAADQTTLVQNEDMEFALQPIVDVTGVKESRQKRKRKLVVDEVKELAGDLIKSQLKDTSDIVTSLDLAPPTKKLMLWKETGGAEKLFGLPGRLHNSKRILVVFARNLQTDIPRDVKRQRRLPPPVPLEEPEVQRDILSESLGDISLSSRLSAAPLLPVEEERPQQTPADSQPGTSSIDQPPPQQQQDFSFMSGRRGSASSSDGDYGGDDPFDGGYDDGDDDIPSIKGDDHEEPVPEEASNVFANEVEEDVEAEEGEDEEKHHERVLNKRAHSMLMGINKLLQQGETVSFTEVTRKLNRKQVASKFYSLLVLKKQQAVEVGQEGSFADIVISRGVLMADML